ncbi:MAG: uroporphyrinogen-III C-methyltransferase [Acidobacteria bacterium]|nr:uroporphyrinogen-III C-methyltransferase [Acidobacteriota bacterium]
MMGTVSLVGAGPGDPDLLTRKAVRKLTEADLVLYDALVPPEMLALAPRAQRFFVGKRAGSKLDRGSAPDPGSVARGDPYAPRRSLAGAPCAPMTALRRPVRPGPWLPHTPCPQREQDSHKAPHSGSIRQETIHRLMIRAARRGKRVVRLKGGDPFVLGRGGEEAMALSAAGIPFEVVPGVSSAIAAPELAGIPVTHRGLASGFVVVSGHAESAYAPILRAIPPNSPLTLIILMGLASREALSALLIDRGWAPTTPAAIMLAASTPRTRTWTGMLSELARAPVDTVPAAAGTIAIGAVVALRMLLAHRSVPARQIEPVAERRHRY